jgi:hypothetical protein
MQHTIKRETLDLNLGGVEPYPSRSGRSGVKTEDTRTTFEVVVPTLRHVQKQTKSKLEESKPA